MSDKAYVFLDCGGPEFDIIVGRKRYHFEMHPYCGPVALTKRGEAAKNQPQAFLFAVSLWAKRGKEVKDGLCIWKD